jgi:tetratricopeptide (TPR) repeat protein
MDSKFVLLDQSTLLRLAVDASRRKESNVSIAYLKEAATRADVSPAVYFLLGAEYAQSGLTEDARSAMANAVRMAPGFFMARFLLGLLLLASDSRQAADTLTPLLALGSGHMLAHFSSGLLHLLRNELADAAHCLRAGMRLNTENDALNADMHRLILEIEQCQSEVGCAHDAHMAVKEKRQEDSAQHLLVSAYTGNSGQAIC